MSSENIFDIIGLVAERNLGELRTSRGAGQRRLRKDASAFLMAMSRSGHSGCPNLRYVMREEIVKE